ncbi:amylo-alpha-1,6-glucosidase [Candidatus Bipolaricaulota bacterium]|nr:amylo-alpha-1,6-glucosidase [Candidatus Bipolaricaulota bacterium]
MNDQESCIKEARSAALDVLRNNFPGPEDDHPRTAAWGYPEPYTRDLMISSLGVLASGDKKLISSISTDLEVLAENQSDHGLVPGLIDDPEDLGATDTTPLFLLGLEVFRRASGKRNYLEDASRAANTWMKYQSPFNNGIIAQLPTTDWRDEHWVFGYGLYVNSLVYLCLKLRGEKSQAAEVKDFVNKRLILEDKPHYALYTYKIYTGRRFDLLGNSLAIIGGIPNEERGRDIVRWVKGRCRRLRVGGNLKGDLPPVLLPYIEPGDEDWRARYKDYNKPGEYHNGGIWPFAVGFYVVALIKLGLLEEANRTLNSLAALVVGSEDPDLSFGFNEWYKAQTGEPEGHDWQTWSAATFIYAEECLKNERVLFLDR